MLFYTAYTSPALVIAARAAQADGLVDKSEPARVLLDAIRRVTGGETVIPPVDPGAFEAAAARLDERDLPVFELLLDGVPTTGLAAMLASDERDTARRAQRVVRRLRPRPGTMQSPRVDQRPTGPPSSVSWWHLRGGAEGTVSHRCIPDPMASHRGAPHDRRLA